MMFFLTLYSSMNPEKRYHRFHGEKKRN